MRVQISKLEPLLIKSDIDSTIEPSDNRGGPSTTIPAIGRITIEIQGDLEISTNIGVLQD